MMKKVLILGSGLQALSTACSLKQENYYVSAFISEESESFYSRFIDNKICPNISVLDEGEYLKFLLDFLIKDKHDVIIPMSDVHAEFLSKNKKIIETKGCKCAIPNYEIFEQVNDKWNLLSFCEKNNFPCPRTRLINSDNINDIINFVGFPALIKPNISVGARGIKLVNKREDLEYYYNIIYKQYGNCSLQEYINNEEDPYYNVMLYRNQYGVIVNYVIIEILRYYPIKGGSSCFCKTIKDDYLLDVCSQVLEKLGWVGFADFDVLKDKEGNYKIIEINPRVPASLRAASVSGVNFPCLIVKDLLEEPVISYNYDVDKYLRFLGLDIAWFLSSNKRFVVKPSWFKFFGDNLFYQEGGRDDYKSMLYSLYSGIKKILTPSFRKSKKI